MFQAFNDFKHDLSVIRYMYYQRKGLSEIRKGG